METQKQKWEETWSLFAASAAANNITSGSKRERQHQVFSWVQKVQVVLSSNPFDLSTSQPQVHKLKVRKGQRKDYPLCLPRNNHIFLWFSSGLVSVCLNPTLTTMTYSKLSSFTILTRTAQLWSFSLPLVSLHRLPPSAHIDYKIPLQTYKVLHGIASECFHWFIYSAWAFVL